MKCTCKNIPSQQCDVCYNEREEQVIDLGIEEMELQRELDTLREKVQYTLSRFKIAELDLMKYHKKYPDGSFKDIATGVKLAGVIFEIYLKGEI